MRHDEPILVEEEEVAARTDLSFNHCTITPFTLLITAAYIAWVSLLIDLGEGNVDGGDAHEQVVHDDRVGHSRDEHSRPRLHSLYLYLLFVGLSSQSAL